MSGILFYKSRRVLRFLVHQDGKIKFSGDLYLDLKKGKVLRIESDSLKHPMPPKEAVRLLRKVRILVSSDRKTREVFGKVQDFFDENFHYSFQRLCPLCLAKGRVKSMKTKYRYLDREVCRECCLEEVKRELTFRKVSPRTIGYLERYLDRFRDYKKVVALLDRGFDPGDSSLTLYDRMDTGGEPGEPEPLESLPIDPGFKALLRRRGIKGLLPVQSLAVGSGLLDGRDLLVVSATASGKTLIAEMAGISAALKGGKFLYLVPLVALANQKYHDFKVYKALGLKTAIRVGMSRIREKGELVVRDTDFKGADIVVGTYEGLDKALRSGRGKEMGKVSCIVIDEVHMLAEEERGPEIDGLIARLRYTFPDAQFIALSATVGNPKELAGHFGLAPVIYDKRPIPLERHLIFAKNEHEKVGVIAKLIKMERSQEFESGYRGQTIVFTNSRRKTESIARSLSGRGLPSAAYHAGLPYARKRKIEKGFMKQEYTSVVTTSALGAGVDFPASQVVFETLAMGNRWITVGEFHQMLGRAGRPLYHERGKVTLVVEVGQRSLFSSREREEDVAFQLLKGAVEPVEVSASSEEVLEQVLASAAAGGAKGLEDITEKMFLEVDTGEACRTLESMGLMKGGGPTQLGRMASTGYLKPSEADFIRKNIKRPPEDILISLFPLENVYLQGGLKDRMEDVYRTRVPARYFDGIGLVFEEPREEFMEVLEMVTQDFLNCRCAEFPYCVHGIRELSRMVLELRQEGLSVAGISKSLGAYKMHAYSGDVFSWLDGIIRKCETLERIYGLYGEEKRKGQARRLRRGLERPSSTKKP
jgi:helicase